MQINLTSTLTNRAAFLRRELKLQLGDALEVRRWDGMRVWVEMRKGRWWGLKMQRGGRDTCVGGGGEGRCVECQWRLKMQRKEGRWDTGREVRWVDEMKGRKR
eukprot:350605-Chlamydomonas_euryale.AAC.2